MPELSFRTYFFNVYYCCRYLFALQVRRDIATGQMPCQEHTAVLLCSFIVQGECTHIYTHILQYYCVLSLYKVSACKLTRAHTGVLLCSFIVQGGCTQTYTHAHIL